MLNVMMHNGGSTRRITGKLLLVLGRSIKISRCPPCLAPKRHATPLMEPTTMLKMQQQQRYFGSRNKRRRRYLSATERRAQQENDRRVLEQAKSGHGIAAPFDDGDQILSESGMRWGFFFTLGVLPLVAFAVAINTQPHLKQQYDELIASMTKASESSTTHDDDGDDDASKPEPPINKDS